MQQHNSLWCSINSVQVPKDTRNDKQMLLAITCNQSTEAINQEKYLQVNLTNTKTKI